MSVDAIPHTLVVDASVGLKWVVDEEGSDLAVALIAGRRLIAPALFWVETANALAMKARRGEMSRAAVSDAWRDLTDGPLEIVPLTPETTTSALALAQDIQHSAYDSVYLAVALAVGCPVLTADRRFSAIVANHPSLASKVILLSSAQMG
jgi:predicted nucleic acid-binding protein